MQWRFVILVYLAFILYRVSPLAPAWAHDGQKNVTVADAMARFWRLGVGTRVAVVSVGLPLYFALEIVPQEAATLCVHAISTLGRLLVRVADRLVWFWLEILVPTAEWLYSLALRATLYVCRQILVPLAQWLLQVYTQLLVPMARWIWWNLVHPLVVQLPRYLWHRVLIPLVEWLWAQSVVVFSVARDLALALWRVARDWIVDKLSRLWDLLASVAQQIYTVAVALGELASALARSTYEIARDSYTVICQVGSDAYGACTSFFNTQK